MTRFLAFFLLLFSVSLLHSGDTMLSAKKKNQNPVTKEAVAKKRQQNQREIKETSKKIKDNTREITRNLNELNLITSEINEYSGTISSLRKNISRIDAQITHLSDSINALESKLNSMSEKYTKALRKMQTRNTTETSDFAFIFSANSISEAYHRTQSLKQFSKWRNRKSTEVLALKGDIEQEKIRLEKSKSERLSLLDSLNTQLSYLSEKKIKSDNLVKQLQKEGKQLKIILEKKQKEADELDKELNRLIQLEQERMRKAEEERLRKEKEEQERQRKEKEKQLQKKETNPEAKSKPIKKDSAPTVSISKGKTEKSQNSSVNTGSFENSKGKLPHPVKGKIVKKFGRQQHPDLKHVQTDNPGIDIEAKPNAEVRAVFDGYVSDIFRLPGYNTIVMVRHGNYLTIYAKLGSISIKKGDKVSQGQVIGELFADPDDSSRGILHFEVRNERSKEDPELWLSR